MNDRSYFYGRAEAELERAQRAVHPGAVKAHYLLAGYYLDRVYYKGESATMFEDGAGEVRGDAG